MRLIAIASALLLAAGGAAAQSGGHIGLYSDVSYSDCNLTEQVLQNNSVYVVHDLAASANTSQFKVDNHWGAIVSDVSYGTNLYLGDIFSGVTVTYVGCKSLPYLVATITFIPVQATTPCYAMEVVADPGLPSGQIEVVDCHSTIYYADGGILCVNIPGCCLINSAQKNVSLGDCTPVGAEATTWGGIKALYR